MQKANEVRSDAAALATVEHGPKPVTTLR
jgi:hypothetical protein